MQKKTQKIIDEQFAKLPKVIQVAITSGDVTKKLRTLAKKHKLLFRSTTLSLYGISLIPLVSMIFQVLFVTILAHQFFTKTLEHRA